MRMLDKQHLLDMSRRELQDLAKVNQIRANLKSSQIIEKLLLLDEIQGYDEGSSDNNAEENHTSRITEKVTEKNESDSPKHAHPTVEESAEQPGLDIKEQISVNEDAKKSDDSAQINEQLSDNEGGLESQRRNEICENHDRNAFSKLEMGQESEQPQIKGAENKRLPNSEESSQNFEGLDRKNVLMQEPESSKDESEGEYSQTNFTIHAEPVASKEQSDTDAESSHNVQEALDTYRKIAMESTAALDTHGCKIPEASASSKTASVATNKKQPATSAQKKPTSKNEPVSVKTTKPRFDLQESLSRPVSWEMKKGPLPPVSVQILEDPNRLCLWSPSRMAERKKEFKNSDFGGTKRRVEGYMADGRSKLSETVRDHRKANESIEVQDE